MDDRIRKIAGFTILTLATFLGIAFISYLFTWKIDQAAAMSYGWGLLFTKGVDVANWMGPLGASVSHTAFYAGFGATSFLPVLRHRLMLTPEREMEGGDLDTTIKTLIEQTEVPR